MKKWIARHLRYIADRIDREGAPKHTGWSFHFVDGVGVVIEQNGKGCHLWYLDDYERSHGDYGKKIT